MTKKKSTVSLANTPVQRALSRSSRGGLIILFVLGIASGLAYQVLFNTPPEPAAPQTVEQARP